MRALSAVKVVFGFGQFRVRAAMADTPAPRADPARVGGGEMSNSLMQHNARLARTTCRLHACCALSSDCPHRYGAARVAKIVGSVMGDIASNARATRGQGRLIFRRHDLQSHQRAGANQGRSRGLLRQD
jgi:hypothetical protein